MWRRHEGAAAHLNEVSCRFRVCSQAHQARQPILQYAQLQPQARTLLQPRR
jgi:hypothetical protein